MSDTTLLTVDNKPRFSAGKVEEFVREHYEMDGTAEPLPSEWDQNFKLNVGENERFVLKVANRGVPAEVLDFQNKAMKLVAVGWPDGTCPRVVPPISGESNPRITDADGSGYFFRVLTFVEGQPLSEITQRSAGLFESVGSALGNLDLCLRDFEHPAMKRSIRWDLARAAWISAYTETIGDPSDRSLVEDLLLQYRGRVAPLMADLPRSVIHNDANDENLLVSAFGQEWRVWGLLDFGDLVWTQTVNELAIGCAYAVLGVDDPLNAAAHVVAGYNGARALSDDEIRVLFPLICMRLAVSVISSAIAAREDPDNLHKQTSATPAWAMLERLAAVDWDRAENRFRAACQVGSLATEHVGNRSRTKRELLDERKHRIGASVGLAYDTPLEIVRGRGQFLFDAGGRAYLDCVNNVCHVGHSHPKVVAALFQQALVLNTNTRYLHPHLVEYAKRLTDTLPDPLSVCFFVNSGSEANELAVRMARTHTGRRDVIVLEGAYHGNTATLVDMSPYKCEGPGGQGLPDWVHKAEKPDPYRGRFAGNRSAGPAYAESVRVTCQGLVAGSRPPALFISEPILGCGGQLVLPEAYLEEAFSHVRAAGGVCIVDEVQVGFGRVGSHMWAFEAHRVVPDIVTLGKPIGNGHPIGAVVTSPEIAESFANGMEFFSSFGGNPVSCAVGMAVLDVVEEEGLRERALRVGRYLTEGFNRLAERHEAIGDVRGPGLFMGVELVRDRETKDPATDETARLVEQLKSDGILISAEGPFHNVLKIKPPLQFDETDADLLLGAVDRFLAHGS